MHKWKYVLADLYLKEWGNWGDGDARGCLPNGIGQNESDGIGDGK